MSQTTVHAKLTNATDDFIGEILPDWLKKGSPEQLGALRDAYGAHLKSQAKIAETFDQVEPLRHFARRLLVDALYQKMSLMVDLDAATWREERRKFKVEIGKLPTDESYFVNEPALSRLMRNFTQQESFYLETGLVYPEDSVNGYPEKVVTLASSDIVKVCRETDAGKRYQDHLSAQFTDSFRDALAQDLRLAFALQVEIAATRKQLPAPELRMLRELAQGVPLSVPQGYGVLCAQVQALDCTLTGLLAVEISNGQGVQGSATTLGSGVLLLLPDDADHPVRHFASWAPVNDFLVGEFKDSARSEELVKRIALEKRAKFQETLSKRLADNEPDLQLALATVTGEVFADMAAERLARIKAEAEMILAPVSQVDARQASERKAALEATGGALLNLAALFVPGVGTLLMADLARQTLEELCLGVRDWSRGHQHEALEHILGVAETVAVNAAVSGGASLVARVFTRSTFAEGLEPVVDDAGRHQLWANDLTRYRDINPPAQLTEHANGLLTDGQRYWWLHEQDHYRVHAATEQGPWRLLDPSQERAYGPALESNGERAWRMMGERPLEWQGANMMLGRLWPKARELTNEYVAQILKVADVDEDHLRGLLVEGHPLPVALRDTLERYAVSARVERFFADIGSSDAELWQWCLNELSLQTSSLNDQVADIDKRAAHLRGRLLDHFATRYLASDPQLALVQRDFPGLPDAYALHLLKQITSKQRVVMRTAQRLPLAVAQQARELLQLARLTRLREGLYLRGSYRAGLDELVFSLLRSHAQWPDAVQLELREHSVSGRLLGRLPESLDTPATAVMVREDEYYRVFDATGGELPASVAGSLELPDALLACLPLADRQRLGWVGEQAASQVRTSLQGWLPEGRSALLALLGTHDVGVPFNPIQRLPDGRVGYVLSGRLPGGNTAPGTLRARIRSLYPGFDEQAVEAFLSILLEQPGSAFHNLLIQERQYRRLRETLALWVGRARGSANQATRRLAAHELRRNWRLVGERVFDLHGVPQGMRLRLAGLSLRSLPDLAAGTDFGHVAELVLVELGVEEIPAGFLGCFPRLRWLNLSNNALTRVPTDLARLPELSNLRMAGNQIRMTAAGVTIMRSLTHLQVLDLSFNPLGAISVQMRPLVRLRELYVRSTNLQTVPTDLHCCQLLEVADLRDNHIGAMPQAMLDAPLALRQSIELGGNPLSVTIQQRMAGLEVDAAAVAPARVEVSVARMTWLRSVAQLQRVARERQWDALHAEPGSDHFFQLLAELTEARDFRVVRADLERRVWTMLEAMHGNTALREELFSLAADPRTCVDSVASCFSALEVRLYVAQALQQNDPIAGRLTRLRVARQLFRLDQVERIARADVEARLAEGRGVDEVEVSLAYRTGLASELELPGQPRTMQFESIAGVTQQQLTAAADRVRQAEGSDQLASFIAQRDFWLEYLRQEYSTAFNEMEAPFWVRLESVSEETAGSEGAYLSQLNRLAAERKAATEALALCLTREALMLPPSSGPEQVPAMQ